MMICLPCWLLAVWSVAGLDVGGNGEGSNKLTGMIISSSGLEDNFAVFIFATTSVAF